MKKLKTDVDLHTEQNVEVHSALMGVRKNIELARNGTTDPTIHLLIHAIEILCAEVEALKGK